MISKLLLQVLSLIYFLLELTNRTVMLKWHSLFYSHIMTISQPSLIDFAICGLTLITAVVPIYAASIIVACLSGGVWIGFRRWGKSLERRKRMRVIFLPWRQQKLMHTFWTFRQTTGFFYFYKTITHTFYYALYTASVSSIVTLKTQSLFQLLYRF